MALLKEQVGAKQQLEQSMGAELEQARTDAAAAMSKAKAAACAAACAARTARRPSRAGS